MTFADILAGVQDIAEAFMLTPITIVNRAPADEDAENPYGDDTIEYENADSPIQVNGWVVDPATKSLDDTGGMSVVVSQPTLRVPVGTDVRRGAIVTIHGKEFRVIGDASDDETWPAMLKVTLAREE